MVPRWGEKIAPPFLFYLLVFSIGDGDDGIGLNFFLGRLTKYLVKKRPWSDVLSFGVCCVVVLFVGFSCYLVGNIV
jgi:hypothetical protein